MQVDEPGDTSRAAGQHSDTSKNQRRPATVQEGARGYRQFLSHSIRSNSRAIAAEWLHRLESVVNEATRDIFPTEHYLDHIPAMIEQVGVILDSGDSEIALVNSIISHKALELGCLRHEQKASISQLLREYDLLAGLLAEYQIGQVEDFAGEVSVQEALDVSDIIGSVIRLILQTTVDAFAERYMVTIEQQTARLKSFNRFVGHEIRSPLNSALLGVDLLRESGEHGAQLASDIEDVRQSLLEVSSVLKNVERLVAIDEQPSVDNPVTQVLALAPFLTDLCQQLSDTLEARDVTVHVPDDLGEVCLETGRLKLLFGNLLSNAIKYSDPDKQERGIWITRNNLTDGSMELVFKDNGLGIPADQLQEVTGLRARAHAQLDEAHSVSGEGLGLYLVDNAIRELGGTVTLKSDLGKGTSVHLIFPAVDD